MLNENTLKAKLLLDKSRLKEIYNLRVIAWESSDKAEFINKEYFPNGWSDDLDSQAIHWIIEDDGQIIASARICLLNDLEEVKEDFSKFQFPSNRPFAFFSRLVVHPSYRGKGLTKLMDEIRLRYLIEHTISFAIAYSSKKKQIVQLVKYGFINIGTMDHKYSVKADKVDTSDVLLLNI